MQSNLSEKSKSYPVIQDILVVPRIIENKMPLGEYHEPAFFGGEAVPVCETSENMLTRLFSRIHDLAQVASRIHTNSMRKTDYMHGITRLITSEFFFHTSEPLDFLQFISLQERIYSMAAAMEENIHLILATFAVRTPENELMNVAIFVTSGKDPVFHFVLKNYPDSQDPVYEMADTKTIFPYLQSDPAKKYGITINKKWHPFSFDNRILCKTAGNLYFYTFIDICMDHLRKITRDTLHELLENAIEKDILWAKLLLTILCSHVLVSNTVEINKEYAIGLIAQADPLYIDIEKNHLEHIESSMKIHFGTPADMFLSPPRSCEISMGNVLTKYYENQLQKMEDEIQRLEKLPKVRARITMQHREQQLGILRNKKEKIQGIIVGFLSDYVGFENGKVDVFSNASNESFLSKNSFLSKRKHIDSRTDSEASDANTAQNPVW